MQICVCRPLWMEALPEYVIYHKRTTHPLTLYINFHNFNIFLDINSPVEQVQSIEMHAHSAQP